MSVTIPISSVLEDQLRMDAAQKGMSLEEYITHVLEFGVGRPAMQDIDQLNEEALLERIPLNLKKHELDEYYFLLQLRKEEQLTEEQHERLKWLTNRLEAAHAERMRYVVALAEKRGSTLEQTMDDLGLQRFAA